MSVRCICYICGRDMVPMRPDKDGVLRRVVTGKYEFHEFVCPATPEQHSVTALAGELKRVREALDAYGPDVEDLAERAATFRAEANRADDAIAALRASEARERELQGKLDAAEAPCVWSVDDDGIWTATCGEVEWCFNDGGPVENKVKRCCGCGHPVQVKQPQDAAEEE